MCLFVGSPSAKSLAQDDTPRCKSDSPSIATDLSLRDIDDSLVVVVMSRRKGRRFSMPIVLRETRSLLAAGELLLQIAPARTTARARLSILSE
jgi:hypothetical protein